MANVMLKYLKYAHILHRRLSLNSVKYYPELFSSRSYTNSKFSKSYATAAYKVASNEDSSAKYNDVQWSSNNGQDVQSVDAALARIDTLIRRNGRTQMKNIHKVFSLIINKETDSKMHGLYLLRSCKYCIDEPPSERIKMVNEIWNKYQELGVEFDVRHYNAMLEVHVKNRLDFNPVEILASMEDLKIEPNKDTYMLIMKKYCQDGNINGASEILEFMKEKQMSADEKVFNYLIEAHVNNNDIAGAKEMVEVMRSSNLEPTAETHTVLACGYAMTGDKDEMMSHLKASRNVQNYLKVIEALASSGNHQQIDEVLSLIDRKEFYQQELINAAVELIHKNHLEVAHKLAIATCTPDYNEGINIFIKQLIKTGKEPSKIVHYCDIIQKGLNQYIYVIAARCFAEEGNLSGTVQMFKKTEELGYFLRPSTFWPLLSSMKEHRSSLDWSFLLKCMTELGVPCDFKTYIDFVYPAIGAVKPDEVVEGIKQSGQALDVATDALFVHYCNTGEIDYAYELTEKFPVAVGNKIDVQNLVHSYQSISEESTPKYFKLLKYIFTEDSEFSARSDTQGQLLTELLLSNRRILEILLDKYQDLTFSENALNVCEMEVRVRNPQRLAFLRKIKSLNAQRGHMSNEKNISVEDEDKYISQLQADKMSCKSFLVKRVFYHIKTKNIVRVQQLLLMFDELNLEYTPLMLSNLFGLWCTASDIDKAKETLDKLKTNFPDFQVELPKALDYVNLLTKYEKFDESYETLKNFLEKPHLYSFKDALYRSIMRFNATLSNCQDNEFVKKMQNLILHLSKELGSKRNLLDPSVNVHLLRNDLKSALEEFRNIVATHKTPASLNHFLKKCITSNEKDILQRVVDLTIGCTSKSYALLELAVAFIETYNTQNAEKVIQNLGPQTDPKVLDSLCIKLCQQNKLNELETLIRITESLTHVNRESLYCHAIKLCDSRNDSQRALQLFEKLEAEVAELQPETTRLIQDLLKKNNQSVPLPLVSKSMSEISPAATEATKTFLGHLEAGDLEAALKELSFLKKGYIRTLSLKTLTDLVDLCLQNNCTHALSLNTHAMTYIFDNVRDVLHPILEKYSEAGDIEKFKVLTTFMPDFALMTVGFNSHFCKAFLASGKYEELLSHLEERTTEKNKLFSIVVFEELMKMSGYEERIFNLALKYLDSNYSLPMTVLWAHYFSKEDHEKAEEIYKKYPLSIERVDNLVLRSIKQRENVDLAKKYVDFVKATTVRSRIKEKAYGVAIDLLVLKGKYDEATDLVVDSEKQNLQLHKYYLSTLVTLKAILEKENKTVPFSIPLDSSSGSDSDSDKKN